MVRCNDGLGRSPLAEHANEDPTHERDLRPVFQKRHEKEPEAHPDALELILMGALVLLVLPILNFISEAISHQGLRGAFAMRIRWLAHRYVLRQSMDFFHNDYAGRVATKVMQAALGVRDAVM